MTKQRMIELLEIELECINRNGNGCDRDCANCDLVQEDWELKEMYKSVVEVLKEGEIK